MSTHLYCLLPSAQLPMMPAGLAGIDAAAVRALEIGEMVAWVSSIEPRPQIVANVVAGDALAGIREHDAVVERALEMGVTPLPARFGQRFRDDDACTAEVDRKATAILALLLAVQGLVEMTLILTPTTRRVVADLIPVLPAMVGEEPGVGRRYLEALKHREDATGAVRQALDTLAERLSEAADEFVQRVSIHEDLAKMPMRAISHLVPRDVIDRYRAAVRAVHPTVDYRFLVVGPRAPYSFASLGASEGGSHGLRLAGP